MTFAYDLLGRRTLMTDGSKLNGGKVTYTYDSLGRLTSHTTAQLDGTLDSTTATRTT